MKAIGVDIKPLFEKIKLDCVCLSEIPKYNLILLFSFLSTFIASSFRFVLPISILDE